MSQQQFEKLVSADRQSAIGLEAVEMFMKTAFGAHEPSAVARWLTGPALAKRSDSDMEAMETALRLRLFQDAARAYDGAALDRALTQPAWEAYWRALGRLDAADLEELTSEAMELLDEPDYGFHAKRAGWSAIFRALTLAWSDFEGAPEDEARSQQEFEGILAFAQRSIDELEHHAADGVLHFCVGLSRALEANGCSRERAQRCSDVAWEALGMLPYEQEVLVVEAYDKILSGQPLSMRLL